METPPDTEQSSQMADNQAAPAARDAASSDQKRPATLDEARDTPMEEVPPPPYSSTYGEMDLSQGGFGTTTRIAGTLASHIHLLLLSWSLRY